MNTCTHEEYEPVETSGEVVAHICLDCLAQLPAWWGCDDCETTETQRLSDLVPTKHLARPCRHHQPEHHSDCPGCKNERRERR